MQYQEPGVHVSPIIWKRYIPHPRSSLSWEFLQYNARSVCKKITEITPEIMSHQPDVVCISETWLTSNKPTGLYSVDGYTSFYIVECSKLVEAS